MDTPADRWNKRDLVAAGQHVVVLLVLLVDRDHQPGGLVGHRRVAADHLAGEITHRRPLGQLKLHLGHAGPLPVTCEQPYRDPQDAITSHGGLERL